MGAAWESASKYMRVGAADGRKAGGSWWRRIWRSRNANRNLACTFCKRSQGNVDKLIAGPKVFICDACVARAEQCVIGPASPEGLALARGDSSARCSFCRKRRGTGRSVVTGAAASICNLCLDVCQQILTDTTE